MGKSAPGSRLNMPSGGLCFILALLVLAATLGLACYELLGAGHRVASTALEGEPAPPKDALKPAGHVLVVLLDSLRRDFVFSPRMPFLSSLRERGAWGSSIVVSIPITISGSHAIFSGSVADPLAFFENYQPSPSSAPNLFMRITRKGGRAVIFDGSLRRAYGQYTDLAPFRPKEFLFSEYREEARYVFEEARPFLASEPWDLAVVPFYAIDYVGHLKTPRSAEYLDILPVIDDYVRRLVEATGERDVVLITAEHGMDDNGFHVDRSPLVVEAPFILIGPGVQRGGPKRVLQIDWAPTLSLLAGVSPFYPTPALPALDLLDLPAEEKAELLAEFSRALGGVSKAASLEELRQRRAEHLRPKGSRLVSAAVLLGALLSMALLAYVALSAEGERWSARRAAKVVGPWLLGLCAASAIIYYSGALDYLSWRFPFSANFILSNPMKVSLAFGLMAVAAYLAMRALGGAGSKAGEGLALFLASSLLVGIFVAENPYQPLSWALVAFPLMGFTATRRVGWVAMFFALWAGLAIRRLTFYNVYSPIALPERWVVTAAVLALGLAYLFFKLWREGETRKGRIAGVGLLLFAPGLAAVAWPFNIETKALLLALLLLPVVVLGSREPRAKGTWLALWVALFLLGTSSDLNHLAHLAALPMLLAVWAASRGGSEASAGLMVGWAIWALYLLPGNGFDFKLRDIGDTFILSSAQTEWIELTVLVIAARYILPAGALLWGMIGEGSRTSLLPVVSGALLPVAGAIGVRLAMLQSSSGVGLPWEHLSRLTVLLGFAVTLLGAFGLVSAASGLFRLARPHASYFQ